MIAADPGSVGEGITVSVRREHLFTPRAFTSLKVNQAIVKAFDGVRVLEPWVVYLNRCTRIRRCHGFETTGRIMDGTASAARRTTSIWRRVVEAPRTRAASGSVSRG